MTDKAKNQLPEVTSKDLKKKLTIDEKKFITAKKSEAFYGDYIELMNTSTSEIFMVKDKFVNTENEAKRQIALLKNRMGLNHETLQKLIDWGCIEHNDWCSKHYEIRSVWQNPVPKMSEVMMSGQHHLETLHHSELTLSSYQILEALSWYEQNGVFHGDIRPCYIIRGSENDTKPYYLADNSVSMNSMGDVTPSHFYCGQQLSFVVSRVKLYLAPEVYYNAKNKNFKDKFDCNKADCFAQGMSILQGGLLSENIQAIYLDNNGEFDKEVLDVLVQKFKDFHYEENSLLCDILEAQLVIDPTQRCTATEIITQIPCYDEIIEHYQKSKVVLEAIGGIAEPISPELRTNKNKFKNDEIVEVQQARRPAQNSSDQDNINIEFLIKENKDQDDKEHPKEAQNQNNKDGNSPSRVSDGKGSNCKLGENVMDRCKPGSYYIDSLGRRIRKSINTRQAYTRDGDRQVDQETITDLGNGYTRAQRRSWRESEKRTRTTCTSPVKYNAEVRKGELSRTVRKSVRIVQGPVYKTSILPPETFQISDSDTTTYARPITRILQDGSRSYEVQDEVVAHNEYRQNAPRVTRVSHAPSRSYYPAHNTGSYYPAHHTGSNYRASNYITPAPNYIQPARIIKTTVRRIDPRTGQLISEEVLPGNYESRYASNCSGANNSGLSFGVDTPAKSSAYNLGYASQYTKGEPSTGDKTLNFSNNKDSLNKMQGKSTISKDEEIQKELDMNEQQNEESESVKTNNPNSTNNFNIGESKLKEKSIED